jgi:hypothetical protein
VIMHCGEIYGYSTCLVRFPELGSTIVVLANLDSESADAAWHSLAGEMFLK